jgi:DNA-directed RNA polymerase subunit RPC12/RpoP
MSLLDAPGTLDPPYASARDRVREVLRLPVRCGKCYKVVAPASQAKKPMGLVCPHCGEWWWRRPPDTGGIWALYLSLPLLAIFGLAIFVGATVLLDAGGPHRAGQAPPGLRPLLVAIAYAVWSIGMAIIAAGACKAGPFPGQKDPDADPGPWLAGELKGCWSVSGGVVFVLCLAGGGLADLFIRNDAPYLVIGLWGGALSGLLIGHLGMTVWGTWLSVQALRHRGEVTAVAGGEVAAVVSGVDEPGHHVCQRCGERHSWRDGNPQPLTQVDKLICAKENLPFNKMKRITCPHCGTVSFSPEPE